MIGGDVCILCQRLEIPGDKSVYIILVLPAIYKKY